MKLIISSVESASVLIVKNNDLRKIGKGLLIYVGISKTDCEDENIDFRIEKLVKKLLNLKLINDPKTDKISLSVKDINGEILLISNFTLYGKNKKGNKVDFLDSGSFEYSKKIYDKIVNLLGKKISLKTGEFGEKMIVESKNVGPLNYILEF